MDKIVLISIAIFLLGFFHGSQGDHLLAILYSEYEQNIYDYPNWIFLKLSLSHLIYVISLILPLILLRERILALSFFSPYTILGTFFLALGSYSFYEFFKLPPKIFHQHDHPHSHEHSHMHPESPQLSKLPLLNDKPETKHINHLHQSPLDFDKPVAVNSDHVHVHVHDHQHEHLHSHNQKDRQIHLHQHICKNKNNIKYITRNSILLVTISLTSLGFSWAVIAIFLASFFTGLFFSIHFLIILYRGKGINLIAKINHDSNFFLGLVGGLTGLYLLCC